MTCGPTGTRYTDQRRSYGVLKCCAQAVCCDLSVWHECVCGGCPQRAVLMCRDLCIVLLHVKIYIYWHGKILIFNSKKIGTIFVHVLKQGLLFYGAAWPSKNQLVFYKHHFLYGKKSQGKNTAVLLLDPKKLQPIF